MSGELLVEMGRTMMLAVLPVAMAAFDKCARPTAEWVGFDQVPA